MPLHQEVRGILVLRGFHFVYGVYGVRLMFVPDLELICSSGLCSAACGSIWSAVESIVHTTEPEIMIIYRNSPEPNT